MSADIGGAEGFLSPRGTTAWQYGTYVLTDLDQRCVAALDGDEQALRDNDGRFVQALGKPAPSPADGGPPLYTDAEIVFTFADITDPSRPLTARVGEELTLRLPGHTTSGYFWDAASAEASVVTVADVGYEPSPGMDTPGVAVVRLRAAGVGSTQVTASEARGGSEPVRKATYSVTVR
jgi:predicted secreted protein